jgi:hypothetical protein
MCGGKDSGMKLSRSFIAAAGVCALLLPGCGKSMIGTYSDSLGSVVLDLRSGGKANFTYMGDVADCSYSVSGTQLTVKCKGDAGTTVFTIHDNDTLTGPPGSFIPALRKQK